MSAIEYGLIGHPLGHSLSPFIHREILAAASLPGAYNLYDIEPADLGIRLPQLMRRLAGLNCTIPHKEAVIPLLGSLDHTAKRCLAVNTIYKNKGYNTDYLGFLADCPDLAGCQVLILGAGGVSRTMALAAVDAGAAVSILARRQEQALQVTAAVKSQNPQSQIDCPADFAAWLELTGADKTGRSASGARTILLNGTPVGLWPHTSGMPLEPGQIDYFSFVYDTIYNPVATRLVLQARSRKIEARSGLGMLFAQALAAQRIWHPQMQIADAEIARIRARLAAAVSEEFPTAIILTGFMGSGKSTVGSRLAAAAGLPFVDLDQEIEQGENCAITEIFAAAGEKAFRQIEQKYLRQQLQSGKSMILAAGGGTLLEAEAENLVRSSACLVVYLDISLEQSIQRVGDGRGRPMIFRQGSQNLRRLYEQRRPLYLLQADLVTEGADTPEVITRSLMADLGFGG